MRTVVTGGAGCIGSNIVELLLAQAHDYQGSLAHGVSRTFNIASASRVTINCLVELLSATSGLRPIIQHSVPRKGDVRHGLADNSAARAAFGYRPTIGLESGLAEYMAWARQGME